MNSIYKTCNRCNKSKPLSEFHKQKDTKDGHRSRCRSCRSTAKEPEPIEHLPGEEWRDVPGFEGLYKVSNKGRVRSLSREYINARGHKTVKVGRLLECTQDWKGYPVARLYKKGEHTDKKVHQLVAEAFLGPCPDGKEVNHKNGDKTDNRVSNLEYVTRVEHMRHSMDELGKYRPHLQEIARRGEDHNSAKLSEEDVIEMRRLHREDGLSATEISKMVPVGISQVCRILKKEAWSHVD